MTDPDVSIVIVNWNTREILRDCLRSIDTDAGTIDYEVIVVDNASADSSAAMVKQEFPRVHLIENDENRGFAAANNQGMAVARARYILLLNSDTVVLDSAVRRTVAFADAHPEAAVVGCRVLNPDRTLQPTCFMYPSLLNMLLSSTYFYKLFPRNRFFGRERMTWWNRGDVRDVEVVTGCFMLVRQKAIEQVGVMDEAFFMYAEETDWCYRFRKAGWKVLFTPGAEIIHLGGGSTKNVKSDMMAQQVASLLLFFRKHRGVLAYLVACLLLTAFFLLRMPFWLFQAFFSTRRRYAWHRVGICARIVIGAACGGRSLYYRR